MKRSVLTVLVLWMMTALAGAGEPITIGETITLQSKVMGEERTILISTPPGYGLGTERYPVLYMTDGDQHITHTRGTVDFLASNGLIPQLIIVGVANTDRTRDLTPTRVETREVNGRVMQNPTSGGAGKFLDFFKSELFPYIDDHYRTLPMR
ncbi:MAG: alpha/beta hydrolase-fold protein, partial [Thermoanaerobaculales bacterium]|nr:alpha/beta hydrolase-fold protein [Thermoanaerobaculales bacterium]